LKLHSSLERHFVHIQSCPGCLMSHVLIWKKIFSLKKVVSLRSFNFKTKCCCCCCWCCVGVSSLNFFFQEMKVTTTKWDCWCCYCDAFTIFENEKINLDDFNSWDFFNILPFFGVTSSIQLLKSLNTNARIGPCNIKIAINQPRRIYLSFHLNFILITYIAYWTYCNYFEKGNLMR